MTSWNPLRRAFAVAVGFVALGGPLVALSARAAEPDAHAAALGTERARLRAELDRVNAEIDALKRRSGVRDDYKLRARLADAESLARRLVEIDARLGLRTAGAASSKPVPEPVASPTDSPADLDAKADILADQARRLRAQADGFGKRAQDIKGRQELRRRAADLDRDPFAPMETSKRRVVSAASAAQALPRTSSNSGSPPADPAPISPSSTSGSSSSPTNVVSTPPTPSGAGFTGGTTKTDNVSPTPSLPGTPTAIESARGGTSDMSIANQLRDLLDTTTLADIRRLEAGRSPGTSAQALDRAATALRSRAAELEARAHTMRPKK